MKIMPFMSIYYIVADEHFKAFWSPWIIEENAESSSNKLDFKKYARKSSIFYFASYTQKNLKCNWRVFL